MSYKLNIGIKKTLKNVGIILTPAIVLEILGNTTGIIPSNYLPVWQSMSALLVYFIKNASENGMWKKK